MVFSVKKSIKKSVPSTDGCSGSECVGCPQEGICEEMDKKVAEDWQEICMVRNALFVNSARAVMSRYEKIQVGKAMLLMGTQIIYSAMDCNMEISKKFVNKLMPYWWNAAEYEVPMAEIIQHQMLVDRGMKN